MSFNSVEQTVKCNIGIQIESFLYNNNFVVNLRLICSKNNQNCTNNNCYVSKNSELIFKSVT